MASAKRRIVFSIDAESLGLYGVSFAVGVSVRDLVHNVEIGTFYANCGLENADPDVKNHPSYEWLMANVVPHLRGQTHKTPREVHEAFWAYYRSWAERDDVDLQIVSDCGAPVEAGLFRSCVLNDVADRAFKAPYPLHELATLLLACGEDPIGNGVRKPDELPAHDPLCDARQSGRQWCELYARIRLTPM